MKIIRFCAKIYSCAHQNEKGETTSAGIKIERAGLGVAEANADGDLKKRADYVSEYTNNENAVAYIIEKFGFV